jgi:LacI family transcriptional regulator
MVTIKDIAREAGVSISTVSFALNGTAPVAPKTRERIFEVVNRLQYQPHAYARGLVKQRTDTICLFMPYSVSGVHHFSVNSGFPHLMEGIKEIVDHKNYNVLLSWDSADCRLGKAIKLARQRAVDGILVLLPRNPPEAIKELQETGIPLVVMSCHEELEAIHTVGIDNHDAAYRNTRHLIDLGHRRIAFISPGPLDLWVAQDRLDGYSEALVDAGLRLYPEYIYIGDERESSGYEAARHFLQLPDSPTAIVAGRDAQSVGILRFARDIGLAVPEDLAIVSFENSAMAEDHGLTSISTNQYEIGRESTRLLFKIMNQKRKGHPQNIVIPAELVVRRSCGSQLPSPRPAII